MNEERLEEQLTRKKNGWKKIFKGKARKVLALVLVAAVAGGFLLYKNKSGQQAAAATVYQEEAV